MKAIRVDEFGEPDVMRLNEVADLHPAVDQVLVRVRAIGVNPVDAYIRSGTYALKPALPYTPGMDAAGDIIEVGQGIAHVRKGDRVYVAGSLTGTYAELVLAKEFQVHLLPQKLTYAQGAAIGVPYATAYRALFHRGGARAGETVLIHGGSGGVGLAAIQLAKAIGLTVVATAGTPEGRDLLKKQGVAYTLDHHDAHFADHLKKVTGNRGVELIIEMLANVNLGEDLRLLAKGGRVVVVGSRGTVEIDPRETMMRDADIRGMSLMIVDQEDLVQIHQALGELFAKGVLNPVIRQELPLAQAAQAHRVRLAKFIDANRFHDWIRTHWRGG